MHLVTLSQEVYNFTTSAAVVIGGVWAYFKFIRGRTFSYRAEPSINLSVEERNNSLYLHVTVKLKNAGLSRLPLSDDMKYIQLNGMVSDGSSSPGSTEWKWLLTQTVFDQHAWVEAQETATDTIVLRLRDTGSQVVEYYAYQVEAWLGAPRGRLTGIGQLWHARAVAFPPASPTVAKTITSGNGSTLIKRFLRI